MTTNEPKRTPWREALSWCRSIFVLDLLIYLYTMVLGTFSLLASLFDKSGRVQHGCARLWAKLILKTCLSPVQMVGGDKIRSLRPRVYAVNHLSALDIPVLYAHLPQQFRIIAKRELFRYPFLGWHLRRSGQLPIDLEQTTSAIRSLRKAIETLTEGMPLVIFPEGARSETGEVQKFLTGAFYIAIKAQVEVVPLAMVGTYEILPMNSFHIRPRPIELVVGDPIATTGLGLADIGTLAARVQRAIEDMYYAHARTADPRKAAASTAE